MELYEHRIVNGILKSLPSISGPEEAKALLSRDVEIIVDPKRVQPEDLWPCIWALAAILSRQFSGKVFIQCDLPIFFPSPTDLGPRVIFTTTPAISALRIGVGVALNGQSEIWGDVRDRRISFQRLLGGGEKAHVVSCFALAGYLGYAALATAVSIPVFREDYLCNELVLPFPTSERNPYSEDGFTFIGIGHLGQAFLSLLYFLSQSWQKRPRVVLVDKDIFGRENYAAQILLEENGNWCGAAKAPYIAEKFCKMGWDAVGEKVKLSWSWKKPSHHPSLAVLGLDDFDPRRMAVEAGYEWIFEAGLGKSFLQPKVTWHSLPPQREMGEIFHQRSPETQGEPDSSREFVKQLLETPGQCGWVTYNSISASAPSMGLVAAAYTWSEILRYKAGERIATRGHSCLWSPLLPFLRESILSSN